MWSVLAGAGAEVDWVLLWGQRSVGSGTSGRAFWRTAGVSLKVQVKFPPGTKSSVTGAAGRAAQAERPWVNGWRQGPKGGMDPDSD